MAHAALSIEILSYSLSIIVLTLLLIVWKRNRSRGLLGMMAMIGCFTVLLVANLALRYTGLRVFAAVKSLVSALMIYVIPAFSAALTDPDPVMRRGRHGLFAAWALLLMTAVAALETARTVGFFGTTGVGAAAAAGRFDVVYPVLFVSLSITIALTCVSVMLRRYREGVNESETPVSWYGGACRIMAYLTLPFLPFFVLFDFPIRLDGIRRSELREVIHTFSVAPVFLLLWNLLLFKGVVAELIRWGGRNEDATDAWMAEFGLSPRETEVCRLLIRGASYDQIERSLFISRSTVKTHTNRIYQKTGTRNQVDLMRRGSGKSDGPSSAPLGS